MPKLPSQYLNIQKRFKGFMKAVEDLGKATKAAGPLNEKTSRLIQLAAAAAIHSEGSPDEHDRVPHRLGRSVLGRRRAEKELKNVNIRVTAIGYECLRILLQKGRMPCQKKQK